MTEGMLTEAFARYFRLAVADTPELLKMAYRIRCDVYCKEFQYESQAAYPDGLESDDFDQRSVHCLVVHQETGVAAGCVRMVQTHDGSTSQQLPLERWCHQSLRHDTLHPGQLPRGALCEISRLAVHPLFRRRPGEGRSPIGNPEAFGFCEQERRAFPLISVALFLAVGSLAMWQGRCHMFAMMEPRLSRLLRKSGLNFIQVGQVIDYHGLRAPYYLTPDRALGSLHAELHQLLQKIQSEIGFDRRFVC